MGAAVDAYRGFVGADDARAAQPGEDGRDLAVETRLGTLQHRIQRALADLERVEVQKQPRQTAVADRMREAQVERQRHDIHAERRAVFQARGYRRQGNAAAARTTPGPRLRTRGFSHLHSGFDPSNRPRWIAWNCSIPRLKVIGPGGLYTPSPRDSEKSLAKRPNRDSTVRMIRPGFLDSESRQDLTELARDGSAAHRLGRRANALVLLDDGMSCEAIAKVLLLDDDTIRTWYRLYEEDGIEGLAASFGYEGSACRLSEAQQDKLKAWITDTLPRTTREVGAWIEKECGIEYQGRSGLVALLHRLDMEHRKPKPVSRKLDPEKQAAFIKKYEDLLNRLDADEVVLFADAVHPTHAVRPVGCWAPKDTPIAVAQTSGRQRLNIHGAIDLETGNTRMLDVPTVDAASTIRLLIALQALYPRKRVIHLFLDNARYHHAKLVQAWLAQPGCRMKLHFVPAYCPHLDSIERLWGLMHKHITHNRCHETFAGFSDAILTFLRDEVPRNWRRYGDDVTDNFRVISPKGFRILA